MGPLGYILIAVGVVVIIALICNIKIVPQAKVYVIERLGGYHATWNTGVHFTVPIIDRVASKISLKENVVDFLRSLLLQRTTLRCRSIPSYSFRILDPKQYTYGVERPMMAMRS